MIKRRILNNNFAFCTAVNSIFICFVRVNYGSIKQCSTSLLLFYLSLPLTQFLCEWNAYRRVRELEWRIERRERMQLRERHTFRRSSRCWCWVLYRFLSITGINSTPNEILITMHSDFWLLMLLLLPRVCRIHSASLNCYVLYLGGNQSCTAFINLFNQITFSVSWIVPRCGTRFSVSAFPPILSVLI